MSLDIRPKDTKADLTEELTFRDSGSGPGGRMADYYHRLNDIPFHEVSVGKLQLLSGQEGSIFWVKTNANCEVPEHSHPMEQITWLVSGRMEAKIGDDQRRAVEAGTLLLIPRGVTHRFWYIDECTIVEFAAPPRDDLFVHAKSNPYGLEPGAKK